MTRWQTIFDDACWIYENYASRAVREGWNAQDLFGIWDGVPHAGGVADRLRGSRSLVLTADRACWRSWEEVERFNRGSYLDLVPFWEVMRA